MPAGGGACLQEHLRHHPKTCQTVLRERLELDTDGSVTTAGPGLHPSYPPFNLNLISGSQRQTGGRTALGLLIFLFNQPIEDRWPS